LDRFARDMTFQTAKVQTMNITDWDSFHSMFAETMGFPEFYGRNMDAWIDCMTGFDDGMTRFAVPPGELFHLEVADTKDFARRVPEIFQAFIECAAFVNWRRVEQGERPVLSLILL
jgi:RNAse (barnase) inhibitor barstar